MDEGVEVVGDLNSIGDIINTSTPPGSLSPQSSPFLKPLRKPPVRRFALAGSSSTTSRRNQGPTLDDELFAASINSDAQDLDSQTKSREADRGQLTTFSRPVSQ